MNYKIAKEKLDNYLSRVSRGKVTTRLAYQSDTTIIESLKYLQKIDLDSSQRNFIKNVNQAWAKHKNRPSVVKQMLPMLVRDLSQEHIEKGKINETVLAQDIMEQIPNIFQQEMVYRETKRYIKKQTGKAITF